MLAHNSTTLSGTTAANAATTTTATIIRRSAAGTSGTTISLPADSRDRQMHPKPTTPAASTNEF